jgi:hypothetical protein
MAPPCSRWHGGVSHPLAPAGRRRHLESRSPCRPGRDRSKIAVVNDLERMSTRPPLPSISIRTGVSVEGISAVRAAGHDGGPRDSDSVVSEQGACLALRVGLLQIVWRSQRDHASRPGGGSERRRSSERDRFR